jgi:Skp family chaperone for outer membrane proteins
VELGALFGYRKTSAYYSMIMKPMFAALLLAFAPVAAFAQQVPTPAARVNANVMPQDKTQSSPRLNPIVEARAEHLSTQMVRDLHLNNYQATRLRAINAEKVAKLDAIERQYARNPKQVEEQSKTVAHERDQEFQAILSTDQYTNYFDARKRYAQADKNYASSASESILVNSIQNPAPVRANDATIGPARKETRRPEPLGRTMRQ